MRIGIFFGGTSREREISFAGGRTVFDNLDKALFEPVPIFVDSLGHFIHLDWQFIYKGTIRDFYPPVSALPPSQHPWQLYIENLGELSEEQLNAAIAEVGRRVPIEELPRLMDFAFLALHGPGGEDGSIQGMLEWLGIPYSGSGILPSALGIDKIAQKRMMQAAGLATPKFRVLGKEVANWASSSNFLDELVQELGLPLVIKAPRQGSSIGVSIVRDANRFDMDAAIDKALFRRTINSYDWQRMKEAGQLAWMRQLIDIREGIGSPMTAQPSKNGFGNSNPRVILNHPEELANFLDESFKPYPTGVKKRVRSTP